VSKPDDPMVILTLNGSTSGYYLPLSQAVLLLPVFATIQRVDWSWADKCFKFVQGSDDYNATVGIKMLSPAQNAQLHLEDAA